MLLTAAERDADAAQRIRAGLVAFYERELLPHAAAEEAVLYPAARQLLDSRLLIESLIAEHSCLMALVDALRITPTASAAAAEARALQVLFEEHVAKENGLVLPLLAVAPDIRLAALLGDMRGVRRLALPPHPRTQSAMTPRRAPAAVGGAAVAEGRKLTFRSWTCGRFLTPCATPRSSALSTPSLPEPPWC